MRKVEALLVFIFVVTFVVLMFAYVIYPRYAECRAHGFSKFYCAGQ